MDLSSEQDRRVVHVSGSLWKRGGGVSKVVWQVAERQVAMGYPVVVAGLKDGKGAPEEGVENDVPYFAAGAVGMPGRIIRVAALKKWLKQHQSGFGLVHSHGLWEYPRQVWPAAPQPLRQV